MTVITPPQRPRCSVFIAISVDGYIARADGSLDWLSLVQMNDEDYGYKAFFSTVDALLIGRNTYDTALGFPAWPYTGKRCVVLTHRALTAQHEEESATGELSPLLARLGREGVAHVYADGGQVIQQCLREGLVDELTLSVVPVLLGAGIPLFSAGSHAALEQTLRLESTRGWPSGLVQLRYRMA